MKALVRLAATIAALAGFCLPARAQYLGQTSPLTVTQTLANNTVCTGAEQDFFPSNLGQTQHAATAQSADATQFTMEIDGKDASNNTYRISEQQIGLSNAPSVGAAINGSGYYPIILIKVTCTAGAHFTLNYAGSSQTPIANVGSALISQLNKIPFRAIDATVDQGAIFQTPFNNAAGTLTFRYSGGSAAGGSLQAVCESNSGSILQTTTFTLANVTTQQLFTVSAMTCPFMLVNYIHPAGLPGGTLVSSEYIFNEPGTINSLASGTTNVQGTTATGANGASVFPVVVGGLDNNNLVIPFHATAFNAGTGFNLNGLAIGGVNAGPGSSYSTNRLPAGGQDGPLATSNYFTSNGVNEVQGRMTNGSGASGQHGGCAGGSFPSGCNGIFVSDSGFVGSANTTITSNGQTITLWTPSLQGVINTCLVFYLASNSSGTTPTIDAYLQDSPDNATWNDRIHFPQVTTGSGTWEASLNGQTPMPVTPVVDRSIAASTIVNGPLSNYGRFVFVVTGTSPSYFVHAQLTCK